MIVYSILFATLLIAFFSFFILLRSREKKFVSCWDKTLLALALAGFVYLYGAWVFLSVYLKYVYALCFTVYFVGVLFNTNKVLVRRSLAGRVSNLFFSVLFFTLNLLYFTGTTGKPETVNLSMPLKGGRYFVFQGGKGLPTNIFHYSFRGAVYAMDLIRLNKFGGRGRYIFSKDLEDYAVFGDTVFSPCNGYIIHAYDDNPDNIPPERKRGPHNINNVLIGNDSFYVFLGHFKERSLFVKAGDSVKTGQPLALVGNSGMSLEPHLHIQVHKRTSDTIPWYKEKPLFIQFNKKNYLLFDEIR
jgi:hypothetical protein